MTKKKFKEFKEKAESIKKGLWDEINEAYKDEEGEDLTPEGLGEYITWNQFISNLFIWHLTTQGQEYWSDIANERV